MGSLKKLNKADITRVPYAANKQWNLDYSCYPNNDSSISIYKGTKITGSFQLEDPSIDPVTNGQYERLVYDSINHLFYQSYSDSVLNTGSLMFNVNTFLSASQQRPTSSYFDYNSNPYLIKNFPSESGAGIRVLNVNQDIYGSKILPHSFNLTSSAYSIKDDGYGNLYDTFQAKDDYVDLKYLTLAYINGYFDDLTPGQDIVHIGNIFYAHGVAVITNPDYQLMFPLPPLALNDSASFLDFENNKNIPLVNNDISRTPSCTIDPSTITLYGDNVQYYTTSSNGSITLNTTTPGNYDVYYTINGVFEATGCTLTSNKAKVSVNVTSLKPIPICLNYEVCPNPVLPFNLIFNLWE